MSNFNVVYPPRGRILFDGGVNSKYPRTAIEDNESPDALNVVYTNGAVEVRGGSTKLNTTAIATAAVDGIYTRHDNTGTAETMIVFCNGSAHEWTGSTFATIASAKSVFTAGVRVGAAEMENHLFCGNGGVTPYKWNGVAWTRHGVPIATGAVSVNCTAAGSLTGDIQYKVTYVNSASVEGDVGTATVTYAAVSKTLRLTAIPTAPQSHGVSARRIYRSIGGGTFGRIATINDNTTTTYDDDGTIASGTAAPSDQGEPPKYSVICRHAGRLFMNDSANPGYLWWTEALEPYTVKVTNFQPVGDASGDLLRGIQTYDQGLILQCDSGIYLYHMPSTTPSEWRLIRTRSPFGSKSPFGAFLYNNKLMVPAMQSGKFVGFAAIAGTTIDPDVTMLDASRAGSDLKSDRIESEMFDVQEAYVGNISAMVFKNKAYVAVTYGNGNTTNNRVYVFDFSRTNLAKNQEASWTPCDGIKATQFTVYDGKLYFGSAQADGFVHQLETSTRSDNSSAINAYYWTKEFSGLPGQENLQKDFRKVAILVDKSGAYRMNVTYRVDSDKGAGITKTVDLNPGSTLWNGFTWGQSDWGGGTDQEEVTLFLDGVSGKRIQFKFSNQNTAAQTFKVHGMNFTYNIKGRR